MSRSAEAVAAIDHQDELELLGSIIRLQVQTASLKIGQRPTSWYDPRFIRTVPALRIDDGGVAGLDGAGGGVAIADVHHRDHPQSKYRGENGVSLGFTGHYARMRDRFGAHLVDGVAGENILVEADREVAEDEVAAGLVIVGAHGSVAMTAVRHAPPCVEFSKFCAGYAPDQRADAMVADALHYLNLGIRGFYATLAGGSPASVTVTPGDAVYRRLRQDIGAGDGRPTSFVASSE